MIAMIGVVARIVLFVFALTASGRLAVADTVFPGAHWESADPASLGWSSDGLAAAEAYARQIGSTAVMIVQDGRVVASWGKPDAKVFVHSIRKSFVSALYGQAVAEQRIDLDRTLADLGVDDKPPALSAAEKQATVRQLLMARSGVYHPAASETKRMKERRPPRGSHAPGTFWYYNNWDFNALGTIYQRATGQDVFNALERRIAQPIGMEDFRASDGKFRHEPSSDHPAYTMALSARDLARFGWLYLNQGRWGDRQIVPMDWVADSVRPYSDAVPGVGYGYLWWPSLADQQLGVTVGAGAFTARGAGGQYVLVAPAHRMVVVHLYETRRRTTELGGKEFGALLKLIMAAAPSAGRG
jgi:CubicO group peptidase (beta-lactamase class C family)